MTNPQADRGEVERTVGTLFRPGMLWKSASRRPRAVS